MPFPEQPAFFPPQQATRFFAARGALFLLDVARLHETAGTLILGKDLLTRITASPLGQRLYAAGAIVPALGVEPGFYTIDIRSTATETSPIPLTHIAFSTGFVLGTETGDLLLANADRLAPWTPGALPNTRTPQPLTNLERTIHISPGWYKVTVVCGLHDAATHEAAVPEDYDLNQDRGAWDEGSSTTMHRRTPRARSIDHEEQWICSFLLDPQPSQPEFAADLEKPLNIFGI